MALADLLRAVEDEAAAERASVEEQAAAEATSILDRTRRDADALRTRLITTAEEQATVDAERDRAHARLAAAAIVRDGREAAFQSVLAALREDLAALRASDAYPDLFRALVAESRAALPEGRDLHVDPRDRDLAAAAAGDLRIHTTLDTGGGVELAGPAGRTIRNTVERRLTNAEALLRGEFAHWLVVDTGPGHGGAS